MDILAGDGNEQQDGLSAIRTAPEDILQLQFKAAQEPQSIFQPKCKYSWSCQQFLPLLQLSCEGAKDGRSRQHLF